MSNEPSSESNSTGDAAPKPPLIDPMRLDAMTAGFPEVRDEIIRLFLDDIRTLTADIDGAFQASDADRLRRAAHTLKGASANVGALGLADAAIGRAHG